MTKDIQTKTSVTIASFKQAFQHYLSLCDSLDINTLETFKELKQKGVIRHDNETIYWHGNHSQANSTISLYYIKEPLPFFVVKEYYNEMSDDSHSRVETWVYVPNE